MLKKTLLIVLLIFISAACAGNRNRSIEQKTGDANVAAEISPGKVKIIGTIVNIDNTKFSDDKNNPCGKQPCWATVKIDSVIAYGAGAPILGKKDTINAKFAFTLGKTTKELFPNLDERMPGLKEGSKFEALVSRLNAFGVENKGAYQIYTYKLLSKN